MVYPMRMITPLLLRQLSHIFCGVLELGLRMQKDQLHRADGAVALFADDQFRQAAQVFAIALIDFLPENETDDIGVLLDSIVDHDIARQEVVRGWDGEVEGLLDAIRLDAGISVPIYVPGCQMINSARPRRSSRSR